MSKNEMTKPTDSNVVTTPQQLLEMAIQNGANMEQFEKLLALQERWEANEAKKAFVKAMSEFRSKCISISKTRKGHNYMYAGLAETIEQVSPQLIECGLSHRWSTKQDDDGRITVTCYLTHELGHSESSSMTSFSDPSGSKNAIQAIGSAISYLQRYTFFAVTGLASKDMDDDAAAVGVNVVSDEQLANINALIDELGDRLDKQAFIKYLKSKGINEIGMIPARDYDAIIKILEKKR